MLRKHVLISPILSSFSYLPAPVNISYWWNWGSMARVTLVIQILTRLFLSIHYISDSALAFDSVIHISRDVNRGFMIRNMHANGASLFLFVIFIHIGRGIYYKSYNKIHVWGVRILLLIFSILTAFLRYVLPWRQISFWGATVITNFLSVIPWYREVIVNWVWGGFAVRRPTLTRFYTFHFLFPFLIAFFSLLHLVFLHEKRSSNPLRVSTRSLKFNFWPYSRVKDFNSFFLVLLRYTLIVIFFPVYLRDPENFIKANSIVTPIHIKPEWYFLFAYAILRCIPNKTIRVIALVLSILVLYLLPVLSKCSGFFYIKGTSFFRSLVFWSFSVNFVVLTWLRRSPVEYPYVRLAQVSSIFYFISLFLLGIL